MHALRWPDFIQSFDKAASKSGFAKHELVQTSAGPVTAWERSATGPRVYLSAGIHGDEPAGPLALLELMNTQFFSPEIDWAICPALNPTGLAHNRRENHSGHDLNRDYWQRACPETSAHVQWLKTSRQPDLFLSLHEDWEAEGFYFYEINLGADTSERALDILNAVQPWFPPEPGRIIDGHIPRERGWIYHDAEPDMPEGWPEAIYLAKNDCPLSFTFETPSMAQMADRVAAHVAAVKSACSRFAK